MEGIFMEVKSCLPILQVRQLSPRKSKRLWIGSRGGVQSFVSHSVFRMFHEKWVCYLPWAIKEQLFWKHFWLKWKHFFPQQLWTNPAPPCQPPTTNTSNPGHSAAVPKHHEVLEHQSGGVLFSLHNGDKIAFFWLRHNCIRISVGRREDKMLKVTLYLCKVIYSAHSVGQLCFLWVSYEFCFFFLPTMYWVLTVFWLCIKIFIIEEHFPDMSPILFQINHFPN